MKYLMIFCCILILLSSCLFIKTIDIHPKISYNKKFFGIWRGMVLAKAICRKIDEPPDFHRILEITIEEPYVTPGEKFTVSIISSWGNCFAPITIKGYIFHDELWAAASDRLHFAHLKLDKNNQLSGRMTIDINGYTSAIKFKGLTKHKFDF